MKKGELAKGRILITGGLGFIGLHLLDALKHKPEHEFVVYDIQARNGKNKNIVMVHGDVFDSSKLLKVISDQEVAGIVHMVGLASIPACRDNPNTSFSLN